MSLELSELFMYLTFSKCLLKTDHVLELTLGEMALLTPFFCEMRMSNDFRIFFSILCEFDQCCLHFRHTEENSRADMEVIVGFLF